MNSALTLPDLNSASPREIVEAIASAPDSARFKRVNAGGIGEVPPCSPARQVYDGRARNVQSFRDFSTVLSVKMQAPDVADLCLSKRCVGDLFTSRHLSRLASRIIYWWFGVALALDRIGNIIFWAAPSKVMRVAAAWRIAGMKGKWLCVRGFAMTLGTSDTVRKILDATHNKRPVTSTSFSRIPMPAIGNASLIDTSPKFCADFPSHFHSPTLLGSGDKSIGGSYQGT